MVKESCERSRLLYVDAEGTDQKFTLISNIVCESVIYSIEKRIYNGVISQIQWTRSLCRDEEPI